MATSTIQSTTMKIETVTLPFTPPKNGFLLVKVTLNSTGRGYVTYNGVFGDFFVDGQNIGDGNLTAIMPVTGGTSVSVKAASNIKNQDYVYVSI